MPKLTLIKRKLSKAELVAGSLLVLVFVAIAIAAPLISPPQTESPYQLPKDGWSLLPQPPGPDHPLGTLAGQYDVFYGLIWGTRLAFKIGLSIALGRAFIGVLLGLLSGYYGKLVDAVIMRITDAFMAFPVMAAAMVMLTLFIRMQGLLLGSSERIIILTLILFGWMQYARLIRGNVLAERSKEYMQATLSVGVPARRILFRHLLPNVTQGLFVLIASDIGAMVVLVAAFNFIGLVGNPGGHPLADWGQMLSLSRDWIIGTPVNAFEYWYTYLPPSLVIVLFSTSWNLIGDGLRDILDPHF